MLLIQPKTAVAWNRTPINDAVDAAREQGLCVWRCFLTDACHKPATVLDPRSGHTFCEAHAGRFSKRIRVTMKPVNHGVITVLSLAAPSSPPVQQ